MNGETQALSHMSRNQSVFSLYSTKSKIPKDPVVRHFEIHDLTQINFSMVYRLEESPLEVSEFEGNTYF